MKNKLLWFKFPNFGDMLSPLIFEHFSKSKAVHADVKEKCKKYVAIGSILNHAKANDIAWGPGIANKNDKIASGVDIHSVRGPLTRKRCLELNVKCPEIYGDPAMLLPKIYNPKIEKQYTIGFTPHVVDYDQCIKQYSSFKNSIIIDFRKEPYEVLDQILSCDYIISSSLHGLIVADAYKIPNIWVKLSNRVLGDDTKFYDHFEAVKKSKTTFVDCRNSTRNQKDMMSHLNKVEIAKFSEEDIDKLIDACPFKK